MPTTVCFDCINALNKAVDFVVGIENAQSVLRRLFEADFKTEEQIFRGEESGQEFIDISDQDINLKEESDHEYNNKILKNIDHNPLPQLLKTKCRNKRDLDSLPLSELSKIRKTTWSNYKWYCTHCGTLFPSIDELITHSMSLHKNCNPFRCTDCNIRKYKLNKFLIHLQYHHKSLRWSCYKCSKEFSTVAAARKHRDTHIDAKFFCEGCNTPFQIENELKKHIESYCQTQKARRLPSELKTDGLACGICQKRFKAKSLLHNHLLIHTERKKEYTCEICGKAYFSKHYLTVHLAMHNSERSHKCQICTQSFKTERLLVRHVDVHNNIKPYNCSECGKSFRLKKHLQSHSIVHTDLHPHVCVYCNKKFRFRTVLVDHIRQHTGDRPYSCPKCERLFANWSNYNKHMKRKHNMDTSKKKHTPDGVYPIDPKTGEVIKNPESSQILEWKKSIFQYKRLGRPRKNNENK